MSYDEHTRYTPPGPVAGYRWTLKNLEYALKFVPKEKLSLGIPVYGYRWFAGDPGKDNRPSTNAASIGGPDVFILSCCGTKTIAFHGFTFTGTKCASGFSIQMSGRSKNG